MSPPLLEVACLGRRGRQGQWLLRGISFRVERGDRWAVSGPTGSGKTLLLRCLALLDPIDEGSLQWKGQTVTGDAIPQYRRQVIYLHQRPVLIEGSVEENLSVPLAFRHRPEQVVSPTELMDLLGSLGRDESFFRKPSRELSGGEGQIVALLRAVQLNPAILLLDEPTAALDAEAAAAVETLAARWLKGRESERAVIWVSHDAAQRNRVADKTITLKEGAIT